MNLCDWLSNNNSVMKEIPSDDRANQGPMKILGLTWDIESDMIGLNKKKQSQVTANLTKREVLQQISSVYDLLGLFSPVTLQGKYSYRHYGIRDLSGMNVYLYKMRFSG